MVWLLWKTVQQSLKKLYTELPYDPETPLWNTYLGEMKTYVRTKTLQTSVHSSSIPNAPKVNATLKYSSTDGSEKRIKSWYMDDPWKHYAKWNKPVTKHYIFYYPN